MCVFNVQCTILFPDYCISALPQLAAVQWNLYNRVILLGMQPLPYKEYLMGPNVMQYSHLQCWPKCDHIIAVPL